VSETAIPMTGRVVAFLDIGTNSVRLFVVRFNPNHSYTILTRQKQQVRLGEGEFEDGVLLPEAIDRTVLVCRKFVDLARTFSCGEFIAVATSATREAANRDDLLNRLRQETQLDVRVISGREEARLIYLGVASGIHFGEQNALFIDIGGGSTEIIVGGEKEYQYLESVKVGAIRLTNHFFRDNLSDPVSPESYKEIQQYVRSKLVYTIQKLKKLKFGRAIGSSGTIINLAEIASRTRFRSNSGQDGVLTRRDLKEVISLLSSLPLEARRRVPGINPDRADIIIAGAAILDVLMKETAIDSLTITPRGLQDGLVIDYLSRMAGFSPFGELSVRQRSVLQLGRSCGINETHARTVCALALELFDSAKRLKLHDYGEREREILEYAAFLHDIGSFISYTNHHSHSWYIISNVELLGFDQKEIAMIANISRFHRKKVPNLKGIDMAPCNEAERQAVRVLSIFLRLAESLDRSHASYVRHAGFRKVDRDTVTLDVIARNDCQLELWGVDNERKAFQRVFDRDILLIVRSEDAEKKA